jgi:hypothetical protein
MDNLISHIQNNLGVYQVNKIHDIWYKMISAKKVKKDEILFVIQFIPKSQKAFIDFI